MSSILGIDPGNNGGMVMLRQRHTGWEVTRSFKLERGEVAIVDFFLQEVTAGTQVWLEKVHGWGSARSFNFGRYYGFVRACAMMRHAEVIDVLPQRWMKQMGVEGKSQTREKRESMRRLAELQLEAHGEELGVTNWNAAAILIAYYGKAHSLQER